MLPVSPQLSSLRLLKLPAAMAAKLSSASSMDNLLANDELEMEKNQQCTCESPNQYDNNGTINVPTAIQRTKSRLNVRCSGERVMIAAMFVAILSLSGVVIALSIYVGELHHRVDRLETQSSSGEAFLTVLNKTQLSSTLELEDDDLSEISHISEELENVKDSVSILENMMIQSNTSLSDAFVFFTNETAANYNIISALQRSLGLIKGDLDLTKTQLRNLSSMYTNLLSDYDQTIHDIYTIRTAIGQNMSQLHDLIHQVESNHSLILVELFRILDEAALNRSVLTHRINDTLNLVGSQGQVISGIKSSVTAVQNSVTGLHGTLTTSVNNLNTRIDDHVDSIQHSLADQSQRLNNYDSRIRDVEEKLASDAVCIVPLGFLHLSAIVHALLIMLCYVIL